MRLPCLAALQRARTAGIHCGFRTSRVCQLENLKSRSQGWLPLHVPLAVNGRQTDEEWRTDLVARFQAADLDGSGYIDREEFQRLVESTNSGKETNMLHWLSDEQIDQLFAHYDLGGDGLISFEAFKKLAEDGVLLEGRLSEYRSLFDSCEVDFEGTIGVNCIQDLCRRLETPLSQEDVAKAMAARFPGGGGRLTFSNFLNMFREHFLDLNQIVQYMALNTMDSEPTPAHLTSKEVAAELVPELQLGQPLVIESSEQFEATMTLHPEREVVLLAGLSWCRPCMGLARPFEKLAKHYRDAVFLKVYGDTNNNTKLFFKNTLKVKATPHLSFHRNGECLYFRTGANKTLLEEAIREHYNLPGNLQFQLPDDILYPETKKSQPPAAVAQST